MITLFAHKIAVNGWKTVIILEELGLKYEIKYLDFSTGEHKDPAFTRYNPNGRIPAIVDHDNGDFVLWESNAITRYLVDRYDKENKIQFSAGSKESYVVDQWLDFQASVQNPTFMHTFQLLQEPVRDTTSIEKARKEIVRQLSVLDGVLADKKYLVGGKPTIADLSFVIWNTVLPLLLEESEAAREIKNFKNFARWQAAVLAHPAVVKTFDIRTKAMAN